METDAVATGQDEVPKDTWPFKVRVSTHVLDLLLGEDDAETLTLRSLDKTIVRITKELLHNWSNHQNEKWDLRVFARQVTGLKVLTDA